MNYRTADRPLDYTPLERTPTLQTFWPQTLGFGAILLVPFVLWCVL